MFERDTLLLRRNLELKLRLELLGIRTHRKEEALLLVKQEIKEERGAQKKEENSLVRVVAERQAIWQSIQGEKRKLQQLKVLVKERKKELTQKIFCFRKGRAADRFKRDCSYICSNKLHYDATSSDRK